MGCQGGNRGQAPCLRQGLCTVCGVKPLWGKGVSPCFEAGLSLRFLQFTSHGVQPPWGGLTGGNISGVKPLGSGQTLASLLGLDPRLWLRPKFTGTLLFQGQVFAGGQTSSTLCLKQRLSSCSDSSILLRFCRLAQILPLCPDSPILLRRFSSCSEGFHLAQKAFAS